MFHSKAVASLMLLILLSSTFIGGITFTVQKSYAQESNCNPSAATVRLHSSGQGVRDLQNILLKLGYDIGASTADGDFGPATEVCS